MALYLGLDPEDGLLHPRQNLADAFRQLEPVGNLLRPALEGPLGAGCPPLGAEERVKEALLRCPLLRLLLQALCGCIEQEEERGEREDKKREV